MLLCKFVAFGCGDLAERAACYALRMLADCVRNAGLEKRNERGGRKIITTFGKTLIQKGGGTVVTRSVLQR